MRDSLNSGRVRAGDVLVIRYERPKRRAGDTGDVDPRGPPRRHGFGRRSRHGHRWTLFRGHARALHRPRVPEAIEGGPIALVKDGDIVSIDIPGRHLNFEISGEEIERRRLSWRSPGGPRLPRPLFPCRHIGRPGRRDLGPTKMAESRRPRIGGITISYSIALDKEFP